MASSTVFAVCSVLMASLFAYSASVQLNDHDWYFWFPLYACACLVNLMNRSGSSKRIVRQIAKMTVLLGTFLFVKVVVEDFSSGGKAGFWSLDLSERVVREKTGSGLVVVSMLLHLEACTCEPKHPLATKNKNFPKYVEYGKVLGPS
ncbi:hypothetical protein Tsubulata_004355 [Turnera subulata]|uniref:DUF4220 domain-containing protein n=1 Tax=Turnera subulata TaxID=218843 RepID=A0A9Q0G783_9ROSI|nr:hypothetical protein Tsubulata_004355 [Turnera subulata]